MKTGPHEEGVTVDCTICELVIHQLMRVNTVGDELTPTVVFPVPVSPNNLLEVVSGNTRKVFSTTHAINSWSAIRRTGGIFEVQVLADSW
jgi:hypothetical protein